jgi:hypothetical protein
LISFAPSVFLILFAAPLEPPYDIDGFIIERDFIDLPLRFGQVAAAPRRVAPGVSLALLANSRTNVLRLKMPVLISAANVATGRRSKRGGRTGGDPRASGDPSMLPSGR